MILEITLAVTMVAMAALSAWHAWVTRGPRDTAWLFLLGAGFGYTFPAVEVNLVGGYTFHGALTVLNLPFHLGLTWFAFYYLSLCLAERLLGAGAPRLRLALATALLFGLLEVQWDLVLLKSGMMEFFIPSFYPWPFHFHPGVPMFHALLGFNWFWAWRVMRGSPRTGAAMATAFTWNVLNPLSVMVCVPLITPMFGAVSPHVGPATEIVLDVLHFGSTFLGVGLVSGLALVWLGRRLGAPMESR